MNKNYIHCKKQSSETAAAFKINHRIIISGFIFLYASIFINSVYSNHIPVHGLSEQENTYPSLSSPNTTDTTSNYCNDNDCTQICSDLRQAYFKGDGEGIRMITEKYPGSGDYCGY